MGTRENKFRSSENLCKQEKTEKGIFDVLPERARKVGLNKKTTEHTPPPPPPAPNSCFAWPKNRSFFAYGNACYADYGPSKAYATLPKGIMGRSCSPFLHGSKFAVSTFRAAARKKLTEAVMSIKKYD